MFHIAIGHYSLINTLRSLHTFIPLPTASPLKIIFYIVMNLVKVLQFPLLLFISLKEI